MVIEIELDLRAKKQPRPHQIDALNAVFAGFAGHGRGRLIMACGTGKTFTSLEVAERLQRERADQHRGQRTSVLFLVPSVSVPSVSLLSQPLREWSYEATVSMRAFAVCSETQVGKQKAKHNDNYPGGDRRLDIAATPRIYSDEKIIGCWNALAKRSGTFTVGTSFGDSTAPMKRAVAFARSIADSKATGLARWASPRSAWRR